MLVKWLPFDRLLIKAFNGQHCSLAGTYINLRWRNSIISYAENISCLTCKVARKSGEQIF